MRYFRLVDDVYYPNRWYLKDINEIENNWDFMSPDTAPSPSSGSFTTDMQTLGSEMDYTKGYSNIQYVSEKARQALLTLPDIDSQLDFYPVTINDYDALQPYYGELYTKLDKIACTLRLNKIHN